MRFWTFTLSYRLPNVCAKNPVGAAEQAAGMPNREAGSILELTERLIIGKLGCRQPWETQLRKLGIRMCWGAHAIGAEQ